jgi:glycerol 2-dehydrogenase (NADP+)
MVISTLGGGGSVGTELRSNDTVAAIAKAHGCSTGVVYLSWAVQRDISVVPKSGSPARIEENIRLVTLSDEEMEALNNLHKTVRRERLSDLSKSLQVEVDGKVTLQGWSKTDFGWEDEQGNWLV